MVDLSEVEQAQSAGHCGTADLVPVVERGFVPTWQVAEEGRSVVALQTFDLGHGEGPEEPRRWGGGPAARSR